jgi:hypothetical protein
MFIYFEEQPGHTKVQLTEEYHPESRLGDSLMRESIWSIGLEKKIQTYLRNTVSTIVLSITLTKTLL